MPLDNRQGAISDMAKVKFGRQTEADLAKLPAAVLRKRCASASSTRAPGSYARASDGVILFAGFSW